MLLSSNRASELTSCSSLPAARRTASRAARFAPEITSTIHEIVSEFRSKRGFLAGTNYNDRGTVGTNFSTLRLRGIPQSEALRVVERFTLVDRDTIRYDVTVADPHAFARPWTASMPLNRSPDYDLFEYACHEGNYGLPNTLRGARAQEQGGAR